jgi:hypothetical protein
MIKSLQYPEDARKALNALFDGLSYDAAISVGGEALSKLPPSQDTPDSSVPFRFGGLKHDGVVRRHAPILLSRFSLISMVSRFEVHLHGLLLQRRVLEYLKVPGKIMDGPHFWKILAKVTCTPESAHN